MKVPPSKSLLLVCIKAILLRVGNSRKNARNIKQYKGWCFLPDRSVSL